MPTTSPPPAPAVPARGAARLLLCGVGMLLPALYFAIRYPLAGNADRLNDLGGLSGRGRPEFWGYVIAMTVLFALYGLALWECRRVAPRRALPVVFGIGAALGATMATMYPATAIDVFIYGAQGRLFTEYGANPSVALPAGYPADPWLPFVPDEWAGKPSPYGPLWHLLSAPIVLVAGDRMPLAIIGFKILAFLSFLTIGWAITQTLVATPGARPAFGALCFLWNPLILWEGLGNGHNDLIMALPIMLAFLAWAREYDMLVIPLLVVATLIKFVPIILIPLAVVALWSRTADSPARGRLLLGSAAISAAVVALAMAPFYDFAALWRIVTERGDPVLTSLAAAAGIALQDRYPRELVEEWGKRIGAGATLVTLAGGIVAVWRRPMRLPRAAFAVLFVLMLTATWYFRSWYLIWLVGPAAILPPGRATVRLWAWTVGAMAVFGLFIWLWSWYGWSFDRAHNLGVAVMFGPLAIVLLAEGAWRIAHSLRAGHDKRAAIREPQESVPA